MCETNIMYALCTVLSFSAELKENGEILLYHCLLADVSMSFSSRCYFCCLSHYSCCLLSEMAIGIYLACDSLFLFFIAVFEWLLAYLWTFIRAEL